MLFLGTGLLLSGSGDQPEPEISDILTKLSKEKE
jgi:hypothetical protein